LKGANHGKGKEELIVAIGFLILLLAAWLALCAAFLGFLGMLP
jgi:hypothetical protein